MLVDSHCSNDSLRSNRTPRVYGDIGIDYACHSFRSSVHLPTMSNRVFVKVGENGRVSRIFRYPGQAITDPEQHLIRELPKIVAVKDVRDQVFERTRDQCEWCGNIITWKTMHMHEKVFRSKGGEVSLENCVGICYECHEGGRGVHGQLGFGGGKLGKV